MSTARNPVDGMRTIFVFHDGQSYPRLESWAVGRKGAVAGAIRMLAHHLRMARTVRSRQYMEAAAAEQFPDFCGADLVVAGKDRKLAEQNWREARQVVLLWPDANGMGWYSIEQEVLRRVTPGAGVKVLNGRRRQFPLSAGILRAFRSRRALEKTMILELCFTALFFIVTPFLVAWDLVRGRS